MSTGNNGEYVIVRFVITRFHCIENRPVRQTVIIPTKQKSSWWTSVRIRLRCHLFSGISRSFVWQVFCNMLHKRSKCTMSPVRVSGWFLRKYFFWRIRYTVYRIHYIYIKVYLQKKVEGPHNYYEFPSKEKCAAFHKYIR
jgi:hypothetical protein